MLRPLLRASAAAAFALLLTPASPAASGPGIAYDEIVRVVVNATPPPPGNFQADLAAVNAPVAMATATPAPRRRGINIGNIAGVIAGGGSVGDVGAAVAQNAVSNAMENAMEQSIGAQFGPLAAAAQSFLQPHLLRYAYWNGWERVDDPAAQSATIRKCDAGQVVRLDLAKKTYTIYTPGSEPTATPAAAPARRGPPPNPEAPGTGKVDFTEATTVVGPLRIENQPTTGYDSTTTIASSQSTGSCRDGSASLRSLQYIAPIQQPTVNLCPVRPALPTTPEQVATQRGGCKPTFAAHRNGPTVPTGRLALYSLVTFSGSGTSSPPPGSAGVGFLTERGNLKTLGASDASLFEIPQGFTKSP